MNENRNSAIKLRKQGKSYNQIVKILGTPKSTLSLWLKNIEMPLAVRKKFWSDVKERQAKSITDFNKKQAEKAKKRAQEIQEKSVKDIGNLSKRDLFLIGVALYWGEGFKKTRWVLSFSNSDPLMIKIIMKFFREICEISNEKIKAMVQTHPNVAPEDAVNYWSKISEIPKNKFQKTYTRLSPSSKQKRNSNTLPFGTLRISICDYKMSNKIKGWIQGIAEKA